jgi:hypothetical protein
MYIKGINDNDLCNLIYKAGALLFPQYESLFSGDIEEFQQHCAVLILPKLKKYDSSKGAISTYIYTFLPLALGNWVARSKEYKTMLLEVNKSRLQDLIEDDVEDMLFEDLEQDIKKDLILKERDIKLRKIISKYPNYCIKEIEDLTFRQLAKRLNVNERRAKYLWYKDMIEIRNKYTNLLKSLY